MKDALNYNLDFKQICADLGMIAYNHPQINSFGIGDIKQCTMDVTTKQEPRYTRMYVVPEEVVLQQNHIHYNFAIIIMDKVEEDLSNLTEVLSDTQETAKDIWTIIYRSYTPGEGNFSWQIVGDWDPDIHPFTERFETILGGWTMHIKIEVPFDYNACVVPIADGFGFPQDQTFESYKVVIDDFKTFADLHYQINSFGFGDITQLTNDIITKQEPEYIRMYVIPDRTQFSPNHLHIGYTVVFADKLEDDASNQIDALSDTLEIVKDFYTKLYLSEYEVDWEASVFPFFEQYETTLVGWTIQLNIIQKFDYNRCVLPEYEFHPGATWEEVKEIWRKVAREWKNV